MAPPVTKHDIRGTKAFVPAGDKRGPASYSTLKTWPPVTRAQTTPQGTSGTPARRPAARVEAGERQRQQDQRLKSALEWQRFEAWCASHGLGPPPAAREMIAIVALYMTYLAANRRSITAIARALLGNRDRRD